MSNAKGKYVLLHLHLLLIMPNWWHHDFNHNDFRHDDTQHNDKKCDFQHKRHDFAASIIMLSDIMLGIGKYLNAEFRYAVTMMIVTILNVLMLSVIMLNDIILNDVCLISFC